MYNKIYIYTYIKHKEYLNLSSIFNIIKIENFIEKKFIKL